jgi:uncharacterized membrane protein
LCHADCRVRIISIDASWKRDRVNLEQDREVNARSRADMEFLAREVASLRIAVGEMATRDFLRSELRELAEELARSRADERQDDPV